MVQDKYKAVWVSHSSMGDFLKCPRAYFLHNVYKDPKTKRKINLVSPALSLGVSVHEVIEGLANYKADERFKQPLLEQYEKVWQKVSGEKGGFKNEADELEAKNRGREMILRVIKNPGPLLNKALKLKNGQNDMPPNFFLSEDENIILCGKIDWLEYVPEDDSVCVLDFKTGKNEENGESLQLPIYQLLLNKLQKRKVSGASYWYLDKDDAPIPVALPSVEESYKRVIEVARRVKVAREAGVYECPRGEKGCFACRPFEKILRGEAEYIGVGEYNQDLYISS
ncbi:PD-(D/E)XK nuclease family protein [Patescibacteria group bacterium]|nr:MAG: PD-(D/E)XK nuclease family protein [Patescibacteria group bacterium]